MSLAQGPASIRTENALLAAYTFADVIFASPDEISGFISPKC